MTSIIKTVDHYVDLLKTVTSNDSAKTKVLALKQAVLKNSIALSTITKVSLTSKHTNIPFLKAPNASASSFVIGGLDVVKELKGPAAKLTDETEEDSNINMEAALDSILTSQSRLVVEKYISDYLTNPANFPVVSGASSKNFTTLLAALKTFPQEIFAIEGNFVALLSYSNYITILSTMTEPQLEMVRRGIIELIPVTGMSDDSGVVLHTHGVVCGFDIAGIEKQRQAGSQYTDLIPQISVGIAGDPEYVKNIKLV